MIKFAYGYFDKKLGAFTSPAIGLDVLDPEKTVVQTERAIKFIHDVKHLEKFDGLQLYFLGEFDDVSGKFISKLELLIDMDSLIYPLKQLLLNKDDGGTEDD